MEGVDRVAVRLRGVGRAADDARRGGARSARGTHCLTRLGTAASRLARGASGDRDGRRSRCLPRVFVGIGLWLVVSPSRRADGVFSAARRGWKGSEWLAVVLA